MASRGSMAADSRRLAEMLLLAMRWNAEKRFARRDIVVWIDGIGTGWSARTSNLAISSRLALVAEPIELECRIAINSYWWWARTKKEKEDLQVINVQPKKISSGGVVAASTCRMSKLQRIRIMAHSLALQALIWNMTLADVSAVWQPAGCTMRTLTTLLVLYPCQTIHLYSLAI